MKQLSVLCLLVIIIVMINSCKEDPAPVPIPDAPPTVTAITPAKGIVDTEVTITGTNFAATVSDNTVKFNSVTATIVSSTATQIIAKVPASAGTGKVTVATTAGSAEGPIFEFLELPKINSIDPLSGPFGASITITGTGFEPTTGANTIKFNGVTAVVTSATATQLIAVVPKGAGSGKVSVATSLGVIDGPEFTYVLSAVVSTLAGAGTAGYADGTGADAKFNFPGGLALDAADNIYVADRENNRIRKITPEGVVTTFAGSGEATSVDGNGVLAKTFKPSGLFMDQQDMLYVTERGSGNIRKITPSGDVTTIAGTGTSGTTDGPVLSAQFNSPIGIVKDSQGNIFIAEFDGNSIRMIANGQVTTFAGSLSGGSDDGTGAAAKFSSPNYLTIDANDNLFVTDFGNYRIRKVSSGAVVTTVAGSELGFANGPAASAKFISLYGIVFDKDGNLLIGDGNNNRIRMLSPDGNVTTLAGSGVAGTVDGVGTLAQLGTPQGIVINSKGEIFFGDRTQFVIRKIVFE